MKVAVVGNYGLGVIDKIKELLPNNFKIIEVDTKAKLENLKNAECIILRGFSMTEKHISKIQNLKFIQRWGAGFDTVDVEAAGQRGIYVSNLPGINAYAVSEMVITHILALYKNLINHHNSATKGIWTRDLYNEKTFTLKNKIVGLIGFGNVGKHVSQMVQGFDAYVQYYDIFKKNTLEEQKFNINYVDFEKLLKTSDIISIHVPLTDSTKDLINKNSISLMKRNAILINTSRGGIVNEDDLFDALNSNRILGAGLDCFNKEPFNENNILLKLENVILTPHVGGASADLSDEMIPPIIDNILRISKNKEPLYVVNKSYFNII